VVRAAIVSMQRAIQAVNKSGAVFSVLRDPYRDYIMEKVRRNNRVKRMGMQRSKTESTRLRIEISCR
jgi:hypothetical protein